jgi:8-oxo-dGTP pyrophosphatase MutT (NUDIX family)
VEEPDTWGTTGGAVPRGETNDFASAVRETREEVGSIPRYRPVRQYVWKAPAPGTFQYTTFILECLDPDWLPDAFNWEAQDARWVSLDEAASLDLHFGLSDLLNKLGESVFPRRAEKL